ncbi:MAG: hypothetical protein LBJ36_09060 [Synergistaceae bacterium]|nr:hypothetical protein [Synergistaceae bacterium]
MHYINTGIFMGLSVWILGFALMVAGWLVEVVFESYGTIPAKILYKTGAIIVAVPVVYLLWKSSRWLSSNRLDIVLFLRSMISAVQSLLNEVLFIASS